MEGCQKSLDPHGQSGELTFDQRKGMWVSSRNLIARPAGWKQKVLGKWLVKIVDE
jgi:hypothetical protein